MDGAYAHEAAEALKLLEQANIEVIWLLPHTSHLTQPLDLVIFFAWKSVRKTTSVPHHIQKKESRRMIQNLEGLYKATSPMNVIQAFRKAGFSINRTEAKPKIAFDLGVVLGNERAPDSEFMTKKHVKDSKARLKVEYGQTETEKAKSKAKVKGKSGAKRSKQEPLPEEANSKLLSYSEWFS